MPRCCTVPRSEEHNNLLSNGGEDSETQTTLAFLAAVMETLLFEASDKLKAKQSA